MGTHSVSSFVGDVFWVSTSGLETTIFAQPIHGNNSYKVVYGLTQQLRPTPLAPIISLAAKTEWRDRSN